MNPDPYGSDARPAAADVSPPSEQALAHAMHAATRDLRPRTAELVRGGLERGRRMRAVRRARIAGAALAVVLATGAGTFAATSGPHASGPTGTAGQPTPTAEVSEVPTPTPTPLPPSPPLTGTVALSTLEKLLPAGVVLKRTTQVIGEDPQDIGGSLTVSVVFQPDDGGGPGVVSLWIAKDTYPVPPCRTDLPVGATCERTSLPDGGILRFDRQYARPMPSGLQPKDQEPEVWMAALARTDGMIIQVYAADIVDLGNLKTPPTRDEPVLSLDQLEAIATSPLWNPLTGPGALPAPGATPTDKPPSTSAPPSGPDRRP